MNKLTEALFNNQLPANLAASQQLNRQLLDLVATLEQRVAELEEKAGSSSRNSSKPPSQDSPEQLAKREKKPKSTRKKGAQPGHPGHHYPDTQYTCGAVCDLAQEPYQRLLKDQWQLAFSTGAVSQATRSVTEWLQPLYQQIGEAVRDLLVAHTDETSHYRNSERRWLWVLCSSQVVYFLTHHSRGKGTANGLLADFNGILVTDQHGGYNDYPIEKHQLCWAHIIRKLKKIAE